MCIDPCCCDLLFWCFYISFLLWEIFGEKSNDILFFCHLFSSLSGWSVITLQLENPLKATCSSCCAARHFCRLLRKAALPSPVWELSCTKCQSIWTLQRPDGCLQADSAHLYGISILIFLKACTSSPSFAPAAVTNLASWKLPYICFL